MEILFDLDTQSGFELSHENARPGEIDFIPEAF